MCCGVEQLCEGVRIGEKYGLVLMVLAQAVVMPPPAQAGPWTRDAERYYVKLSQGLFTAEGFRDASGSFNRQTRYLGLTSALYGELGLGQRTQAQLYLPFLIGINDFADDSALRLSTVCENGRRVEQTMRRGFGDAIAGAQWTPSLFAFPHAVRLNAKLPLYDLGEPRGRCALLFPQPGDGQLDFELWLSAGDSFGSDGRFYGFFELGHQLRSELYLGADPGQTFGDSFLSFGEVGGRVVGTLHVKLSAKLVLPYTRDTATKGFVAFGPGLYLPLGRGFAAELNVDLTPWARNAASGTSDRLFFTTAIIGISHKRD